MKYFIIALVLLMVPGCATITKELTSEQERLIDQECAMKNSVASIHDNVE